MISRLLAGALITLSLNAHAGKLLVVGGALKSSSSDVYQAFIASVAPEQRIAIVPVASGRPHTYAQKMVKDLLRYGVASERIVVLPLALIDDPATAEDESLWRSNAAKPSVWREGPSVGGFWFVGGDQTRITAALRPDGKDSAMAAWMRTRLADGAIIAGTSAGAAMMSELMIAGGDSISALMKTASREYAGMESQENGRLYLNQGMGFWPGVLVDQHFDRKARLGRLTAAMCTDKSPWGVGVDEDTALLVDLARGHWQALGNGNVTLLNSAAIDCQRSEQRFHISGLTLWMLARGDQFLSATRTLITAAGKQPTVGREAFAHEVWSAGGPAVGNARLDETLGFDLLDNENQSQLSRWTWLKLAGTEHLIEYRFTQGPDAQGYWAYLDGTKDSYSAAEVDYRLEYTRVETKP